MPITSKEFIDKYAAHALDDNISLMIGAGASCDAGFPSWKELYRPIAQKLQIDLTEHSDLFKIGQYYSNKFGRPELRRVIHDEISNYKYESKLIEELLDIGFSNIWTTNFDRVIERNYEHRGVLVNLIARDNELLSVRLNERVNLFKLNGDIGDLDNIIATQSDYESYTKTHPAMLTFLKRELISSTFLFIGYSFLDNLFLSALSEINQIFGSSANFHYAIMKSKPKDREFELFVDDLERRYSLRILLVEDYSEIPQIISEVNNAIRSRRIFISGAFQTNASEIEEYSHALSKALSYKLLSEKYRIVNGIGSRFGTHLIGYSNEYLYKKGIKNPEKHLIIEAFVGNDSDAAEKKYAERKRVLSSCGASIYAFGEEDRNGMDNISGVMEEFNIALDLHHTIIPISVPGMISDKIWKEVGTSLTKYPYLEGKLERLTSAEPVDSLIGIIINILDSTRN